MADETPRLWRGCKGPAVARWQRIVGVTADSDFGPNTERATRVWQGAMGLPQTGEVWLSDWRWAAQADEPVDYAEARWIRARHFRRGRAGEVRFVCLHSIECSIRPGAAMSLAKTWQSVSSRAASSHYIVDADEAIQCVREIDTAYTAAQTGNAHGIHIEMAGRALETDWLVEGRKVVERAARLVADICQRHLLPIQPLGAEGLKLSLRGITTHANISEAWRETNHVDPGGPGDRKWPWAEFLALLA